MWGREWGRERKIENEKIPQRFYRTRLFEVIYTQQDWNALWIGLIVVRVLFLLMIQQ